MGTVLPVHTAFAPEIVAVGNEKIVIIFCSVSVHPLALVTVTV